MIYLLVAALLACGLGRAQSGPAVPTFTGSYTVAGKQYRYTIAGRNPERGGTTTIATVLVPISLVFQASKSAAGHEAVMSAASDVSKVVNSPIFQKAPFATGKTQYGDALQRAEFYTEARSRTGAEAWHTLLSRPRITSVLRIQVPVSDGYLLTSKRTGLSLSVADLEFIKHQLFEALPGMQVRPNDLVIALAKNVAFYPLNDATVCCSWGAHGVQAGTPSRPAQPFILSTYLDPGVVPRYSDIQPLSEQIAEWLNDPLQGDRPNTFPAWRMPPKGRLCGGTGEGSFYRFAEPTDSPSIANATPIRMHGTLYHLENAALLPWFMENLNPGTFHHVYSFPGTHALTSAAEPCPSFRQPPAPITPSTSPAPKRHLPNGHQLIGYWVGYSPAKTLPLRQVSPQWDVIIVAFAAPAKGSTSLMQFRTPAGYTEAQFKSDIADLQSRGKKVLISLGGGGQVVSLNTAQDLRNFLTSVSAIVSEYGFNGVDLDFETPSLMLEPGDGDFRKPFTPSVVNLIAAMRQLRRRFGPKFMIGEVPEGPQVPAGLEAYGGQFGSFLPVIYGTRDILSFVDVQNYNTPPLEGLDGNYYLPETADYYVAMTDMLLHGFVVGHNPRRFFPPLPPQKIAIGFLVGRSSLPAIKDALRYLTEGKGYAGQKYRAQRTARYTDLDGAMFWNIQADRRDNYRMSNAIGPLLHELAAGR